MPDPEPTGELIPEGGQYISSDGTIRVAGEPFPVPQVEDTYTYTDYKYTYSLDSAYKDGEGWMVKLNSLLPNRVNYDNILSEIAGKSVVDMDSCFASDSTIQTAPSIPDTIEAMNLAFYGCISLVNFQSSIPEGVRYMEKTFYGCERLTGDIYVNTVHLVSYDLCFANTDLPIHLKGNSPVLHLLAGTATEGNVTYDNDSGGGSVVN